MSMFGVRCSIFDGWSWFGFVADSQIADRASHIPLAWRPFLDPAPIDGYWIWFLPPLILIIAVVYRTIKTEDLSKVPRRAAYLAFQIGVFFVLAAVLIWLVLLFV